MVDKKEPPRHDLPSSSAQVRNNFIVGELLGSGSFGNVYAVELKSDRSKRFAMKELTRNSLPKFIATELRILRNYGGRCNVMGMHAAFRDQERVFIVMDYFPHDQIVDLFPTLTNEEILAYMKNMLIALDYLHSKRVIHRDIKPSNFLYNREQRRYSLIDFGLAQTYNPKDAEKSYRSKSRRNTFGTSNINTSYSAMDSTLMFNSSGPLQDITGDENARGTKRKSDVSNSSNSGGSRTKTSPQCACLGNPTICSVCTKLPQNHVNKAGTPGFRAPEVLLRSVDQTCAIDIWSAGVTFLSICARKHPIMRVDDDCEALGQIATLFGESELKRLAVHCNHYLQLNPPCSAHGVDLVRFAKYHCAGLNGVPPPSKACHECRNLIHENHLGQCICHYHQEESLRQLPPDERMMFEVISHALSISPHQRYTASMLLSLL